mgnify:FL=1
MLRKTVHYTDFNGNEAEEVLYFNLSMPELLEMDNSGPGGLKERLNTMIEETDGQAILKTITDLIYKAYGKKSEDGKKFIKNGALADDFFQSAAYEALFEELITDENAAAAFVNGIVPKKVQDQIAKMQNSQE